MDVRIKVDDNGNVVAFMLWHPVGDSWVHVYQEMNQGAIRYFTDGEEVTELPPPPEGMAETTTSYEESIETNIKDT